MLQEAGLCCGNLPVSRADLHEPDDFARDTPASLIGTIVRLDRLCFALHGMVRLFV